MRKNRILSTQINGDLYKDLLKRCKEEGTTVTGACEEVEKGFLCTYIHRMMGLLRNANNSHNDFMPFSASPFFIGAIAAAVMLEIKSLIVDKPSAALKMETMVRMHTGLF